MQIWVLLSSAVLNPPHTVFLFFFFFLKYSLWFDLYTYELYCTVLYRIMYHTNYMYHPEKPA